MILMEQFLLGAACSHSESQSLMSRWSKIDKIVSNRSPIFKLIMVSDVTAFSMNVNDYVPDKFDFIQWKSIC